MTSHKQTQSFLNMLRRTTNLPFVFTFGTGGQQVGSRNPFAYKRLSTRLPTYLYINTIILSICIYTYFGGHSFLLKKDLALVFFKFGRYVGSHPSQAKHHKGLRWSTLLSTYAEIVDTAGVLFYDVRA